MRSAGSRVVLAIGLIAMSWSCQTNDPLAFKAAPLLGVVYDETRLPVDGAVIQLSVGDSVVSDVNGRFTIVDVPKGSVQFSAWRQGYRRLNGEFHFSNRTHILYVKMESAASLRHAIETEIKAGNVIEAARMCNELLEMDPQNPTSRFLAGIAFYRAGEMERAVEQVKWLAVTGVESAAIGKLMGAITASGDRGSM